MFLADNNLSGEIPTKFGDLRNLNVLDLRECSNGFYVSYFECPPLII